MVAGGWVRALSLSLSLSLPLPLSDISVGGWVKNIEKVVTPAIALRLYMFALSLSLSPLSKICCAPAW
jgi:hypothetical protein